MKLVLLLVALWLPSAVSSSSLRNLVTGACLSGLDQIPFSSACSHTSVEANVEAALVGTGCTHSALDEIKLLSGNTHSWQAKQFLVDHCNTLDFDPCLDLETVAFRGICDHTSVYEDLEGALLSYGTCAHGVDKELTLITGETHNWHAKVALTAHCKALDHSPCLDKTTIPFSSACSTDSVVDDVEDALVALGTCAHQAEREVELLTDIINSSWQSKVELSTFCKTLDHATCLNLATMPFTSTCSTTSVEQDVHNALDDATCPHGAEREIILLTNDLSSWNSKVALANYCESLDHGPCLDKTTIDFTTACSTDSVTDDVANALLALGTCAHEADREVELLTGIDSDWNSKVELSAFCKTLDHQPCLDLDILAFTSTCSTDSVKQDVETALIGADCAHDADREIMLLTNEPSSWNSKVALANYCKTLEHGPCLNKTTIVFTSTCSTDSVTADVADALLVLATCPHGADREVELLSGINSDWNSKVELSTFCKTLDHAPCLMEASIPFASTCTTESVKQDVTNALSGSDCPHETNREMELLTDESSSWQAQVALKNYCRTLDHEACVDLTDLVFPNCEDVTLVSIIEMALDAASCPHDLQMELFIHTGIEATWQSKPHVIETVCVPSLTACLSVEDLLIFNCNNGLVTGVVTNALPATCTHSVQQEIELLGNNTHSWQASMTISEECHTYIEPCTAPTMADYVMDNCKNPLNVVKDLLANTNCPTHDKYQMEIIALTGMPDVTSAVDLLKAECIDARVSCTKDTWDNTMVNGCDMTSIVQAVKDQVADTVTCYHNWETEIELLTGAAVDDQEAAMLFITTMCDAAWNDVTTSSFMDIKKPGDPPVFTDTFMEEYAMGDTFLNTETGNFQGPENPAYPDSQMDSRTRDIGEGIDLFRNGVNGDDGVGTNTLLKGFPALESCETAILCCFGRDRQSEDDNGDCAQNDCDNKGPADNSNLCYVEEPAFTAYPNADEGSIHCHGLTWSEDVNDFTQRLRFNNFFFVSLYDHMYSRGYVEPMIEDNQVLPMCDCIEEMPPVVRSDCTQLDVELNFALNTDANGLLTAATQNDMQIAFNACRGNPNNDLAAYAKKLHRHKEISDATFETILDTLVGEIGGGNDQEGVCQTEVAAYGGR